MDTNHITQSIITKGVIGGTLALVTKGILSDGIEIIITTKRGRKFGGSSAGVLGGYYDKEFYKKFQRKLKEDDDEIELIEVKIRKKYLPQLYIISAELLRPTIEAHFVKIDLIDEKNKPTINIELIDEPDPPPKPKEVKAKLIDTENKKSPKK